MSDPRASRLLWLLWLPWLSVPAPAYSVLTHEAIIDSAWTTDIQPQLRRRFPGATPGDLVNAHAYAYGGCILQDMGYYPFGSKFFSDLAHYVRSGDFVAALFEQAQTLNDLAFAYGALAHYAADINGHSLAVNLAVPIEYPRLWEKYGSVVTYAEDPPAHLKTEFGFDVLQVAHGRYAPQAYHDFIGFQVDREALDRAVGQVYGLRLSDIFASQDLALGTYRYAVSRLIPTATRVAWHIHEKEIMRDQPGISRSKFLYNLSRAAYRKQWGSGYRAPGLGARLLGFVLRIMPRIGPFRTLAFKAPTPEAARLFEASFNRTLSMYRELIRRQAAGALRLGEVNLDTGDAVKLGSYSLADRAYRTLLRKLADRNFANVPGAMRRDILRFYGGAIAAVPAGTEAEDWNETVSALEKLRASQSGITP